MPASWVGQSLDALMVAGTINPGQLKAVREILYDQTPADDIDVAVFNDEIANYVLDINPDNSLTITHVPIVGVAAGRRRRPDHRRWHRHPAQRRGARFSDGVRGFIDYSVNFLFNAIATGAPSISDLTPTSGQRWSLDAGDLRPEQAPGHVRLPVAGLGQQRPHLERYRRRRLRYVHPDCGRDRQDRSTSSSRSSTAFASASGSCPVLPPLSATC